MKVEQWQGCYDDGWQGLIVPEAFAHPAKMAYGLLRRIYAHIEACKWIKPDSVIMDPFGGIGTTGLVGAYKGYQVVSVELEQKFVELARENYALHAKKWAKLGCPQPIMLQGDSRRLSDVIAGADCVVGSPPFLENNVNIGAVGNTPGKRQQIHNSKPRKGSYGQTPGQLGSMKPGSVQAIISSPPYVDAVKTGEGPGAKEWSEEKGHWIAADYTQGKYGVALGNLGNLKPGAVDCVLSSPPYEDEDGLGHGGGPATSIDLKKGLCNQKRGYGKTQGQIENLSGNTFWAAAKEILQECHKILKPGGHAIWVVKAFVRKGKIVDFPGDWRRLCESVGFKTVCVHHAMLVKEEHHNGLFGTITEKKERKSFFRRLAERKGAPRIDYEVVLCTEKEQ